MFSQNAIRSLSSPSSYKKIFDISNAIRDVTNDQRVIITKQNENERVVVASKFDSSAEDSMMKVYDYINNNMTFLASHFSFPESSDLAIDQVKIIEQAQESLEKISAWVEKTFEARQQKIDSFRNSIIGRVRLWFSFSTSNKTEELRRTKDSITTRKSELSILLSKELAAKRQASIIELGNELSNASKALDEIIHNYTAKVAETNEKFNESEKTFGDKLDASREISKHLKGLKEELDRFRLPIEGHWIVLRKMITPDQRLSEEIQEIIRKFPNISQSLASINSATDVEALVNEIRTLNQDVEIEQHITTIRAYIENRKTIEQTLADLRAQFPKNPKDIDNLIKKLSSLSRQFNKLDQQNTLLANRLLPVPTTDPELKKTRGERTENATLTETCIESFFQVEQTLTLTKQLFALDPQFRSRNISISEQQMRALSLFKNLEEHFQKLEGELGKDYPKLIEDTNNTIITEKGKLDKINNLIPIKESWWKRLLWRIKGGDLEKLEEKTSDAELKRLTNAFTCSPSESAKNELQKIKDLIEIKKSGWRRLLWRLKGDVLKEIKEETSPRTIENIKNRLSSAQSRLVELTKKKEEAEVLKPRLAESKQAFEEELLKNSGQAKELIGLFPFLKQIFSLDMESIEYPTMKLDMIEHPIFGSLSISSQREFLKFDDSFNSLMTNVSKLKAVFRNVSPIEPGKTPQEVALEKQKLAESNQEWKKADQSPPNPQQVEEAQVEEARRVAMRKQQKLIERDIRTAGLNVLAALTELRDVIYSTKKRTI